jgi:hypothetical protein
MLGSGFDTFLLQILGFFHDWVEVFFLWILAKPHSLLWHSFDIIATLCIHFAVTTTFKHQALLAMCTSY